MPTGTATGATPDATGATPDASQPPVDDNVEGTPAAGATPVAAEVLGEAGLAAIERERELRKASEKTAKELAARIKAIEEKDLPEHEKVTRERDTLRGDNDRLMSELRQERLNNSVIASASRLGFADPADAVRLIDVEFDDDGRPKDVDTKLAALLKAKPYLASAMARPSGSADGGNNGGQPSGGADMNQLIRQAVGRGG
jgi:hypothetical protein